MGLVTLSCLDLFVLALATWRLSYMLVEEEGPFKMFNFIRYYSRFGALTCIYCTSVWVAAGLGALHIYITPLASWWLAISGLAMILRAYTGAGIHDKDRDRPEKTP